MLLLLTTILFQMAFRLAGVSAFYDHQKESIVVALKDLKPEPLIPDYVSGKCTIALRYVTAEELMHEIGRGTLVWHSITTYERVRFHHAIEEAIEAVFNDDSLGINLKLFKQPSFGTTEKLVLLKSGQVELAKKGFQDELNVTIGKKYFNLGGKTGSKNPSALIKSICEKTEEKFHYPLKCINNITTVLESSYPVLGLAQKDANLKRLVEITLACDIVLNQNLVRIQNEY